MFRMFLFCEKKFLESMYKPVDIKDIIPEDEYNYLVQIKRISQIAPRVILQIFFLVLMLELRSQLNLLLDGVKIKFNHASWFCQ